MGIEQKYQYELAKKKIVWGNKKRIYLVYELIYEMVIVNKSV